jgi:DNA-binding NarL/FixJ family response regulator
MAVRLEPDVVVLDLSMPEMNGLTAARHILRTAPQTNVLILTLHEGEDLTRAVLEAGAGACVSKTELHSLAREVRTLYKSGNYRPCDAASHEAIPPPGGVEEFFGQSSDTPLTANERRVLQLLAQSKTSREIAIALSMTTQTVEAYRSAIMDKLGVDSVVDCIRYAIGKKG